MMNTVKWLGGRKCDICGSQIEGTLYDARTAFGPWATMCESCFLENGGSLGLGRGQKYEQRGDDFVKVEG